MASSQVILCVLHLKGSLVLPASDGFDDGARGHVRLLKILVGAKQEGENRGYKMHILPSSRFSPQFDVFMSTPSHMP